MRKINFYTYSQRQRELDVARHFASKPSSRPSGRGFLNVFHLIINHLWLLYVCTLGLIQKSTEWLELTWAQFVGVCTCNLSLPALLLVCRYAPVQQMTDPSVRARVAWRWMLGQEVEAPCVCSHSRA